MGNQSPRNAKVYSYNHPGQRVLTTTIRNDSNNQVAEIISRTDWKALHQLLLQQPQLVINHDESLIVKNNPGGEISSEQKTAILKAIEVRAPGNIIEVIYNIAPKSFRICDKNGWFPIHYTVKYGATLDIIELLFNWDKTCLDLVDTEGNMPLHITLIHQPHFEKVRLLVEKNSKAVEVRNKSGALPLHLAIQHRASPEVIELLLDKFPISVQQSYQSNLPLHLACAYHSQEVDVVDSLLKRDKASAAVKGAGGQYPIHFACGNRGTCLLVIQRLCGANSIGLMERSGKGSFPLHLAIENKFTEERISYLIAKWPDAVRERGRGTPGNFPLAMAIENKLADVIILQLLNIYPEAADQVTVYRMLPLQSAIKQRMSWSVIEAVLEANPLAASEVDSAGRIALHYAVSRGFPTSLLDKLLRSYPEGVAKVDRTGQIPLHLAAIRKAPIEVFNQLLERYPAGAKLLDNHNFNPINYAIESDASIECIQAMIAADVRGLDWQGRGKLVLHHAIEFQRCTELIELITTAFPRAAEIPQAHSGKLAIHLAILRPLPFKSLLIIEKAFPEAAKVMDNDGLMPVHYAIRERTDDQLCRILLATNMEIAQVDSLPLHCVGDSTSASDRVCCRGHRLLLHYAIDNNATPESLAHVLLCTMPLKMLQDNSFQLYQDHMYSWTHVLGHTSDKYWRTIELVLEGYSQECIEALVVFLDEECNRALDIATPLCHSVLIHRLYYYYRYQLDDQLYHRSKYALVCKALDHNEGTKVRVALKFMSCRDAFLCELKTREEHPALRNKRFVVPLVASHNGDEDYNYREEAIRKGFREYNYLLVTMAAERSLDDIIRHDGFAGSDWKLIQEKTKLLLDAVDYLHAMNLVHTNLSPGTVLELQGNLVLANFAHVRSIPRAEDVDISYGSRALAYVCPEIALLYALLKKSESKSRQGSSDGRRQLRLTPAAPPKAECAMDMWSVGAIIYFMCTGETLFLNTFEESVDDDQLEMLIKWPEFVKQKRIKKILNPKARNLVEQLLSRDPEMRPSASYCLQHPFVRDVIDNSDMNLSNRARTPRFPGMPAGYGMYIAYRDEPDVPVDDELSFRSGLSMLKRSKIQIIEVKDAAHSHFLISELTHFISNITTTGGDFNDSPNEVTKEKEEKEKRDVSTEYDGTETTEDGDRTGNKTALQNSRGRDHKPITLANTADFEASRLSYPPRAIEEEEEGIFDKWDDKVCRMSQSKSCVIILSRSAINSPGLHVGHLTKSSPCNDFLFEIRLAVELAGRGLFEEGLYVLAVGDYKIDRDAEATALVAEGHDSSLPVYFPFFENLNGVMTTNRGGCFPDHPSDLVVEALERRISEAMSKHGYGPLRYPNMTINAMFNVLFRFPIIHALGTKEVAFRAASSEILEKTLPRVVSTGWRSRPNTGAAAASSFKRSSRGGSPIRNHTPGGLRGFSRGGEQQAEADEDNNFEVSNDIKFFDDHQSRHQLPYFTEMVSADQEESTKMLHFLAEKVEMKENEIQSLEEEMSLLEEKVRMQQEEMNRLRALVQVTRPDHM